MNEEYKHKPSDVLEPITEQECTNLGENTGLDGSKNGNCEDLSGQLLDDLRQELDNVLSAGNVTIFANEESKCSETDTNATLASWWSRVYRYAQAITCILCNYDPFIATLLKSGRYPQILMGSVQAGGYPQWISPDELPKAGSELPVTSDGVYQAIQSAIMSVWHEWAEYPSFTYYADNKADLESQSDDAEDGDTAIVRDGEGDNKNQIYNYNNGTWTPGTVIGLDGVENFAVTHIVKGDYADKEMYYFKDNITGEPTWNLLNAHLGEIETKIERLERLLGTAVFGQSTGEHYLLTTRTTLEEAMAVPATEGKTTITLITG